MPTKPKIGIVGKGAIGSLLSFKCATLKLNYQLLLRTKQDFCFQVQDITGKQHKITPAVSDIHHPKSFDVLILPVKAYQVMPILLQMKPFIQSHHVLVLLHNGMGTIEQVRAMFPNNSLVAATTSYGAFKPSDQRITETGLGETHFGWIKKPNTSLQNSITPILSSLLPPSTWHKDITLALWKKLAINGVINPLTAIHNIKNGQLSDIEYQKDIAEICAEIAQVMSKAGYPVTTLELINNVLYVINATANNYSSMHQDIAFMRKTEIEYINGYVLKMATKLNIKTPINHFLVEQIRRLDTKKDA